MHDFSFKGNDFEEVTYGYSDYTGASIYGISYLYQGIPYHVDIIVGTDELPEMYLRQIAALQSDICIDADDSMIFLSDSKEGAIVWHEFYGRDLWVVYMTENATEDALLQMKAQFQNTWQ